MTIDYDDIYKKAAEKGGWSKMELDTETSWGDIYDNLSKELTSDEVVLDIGTAEGNRFLMIADKIKSGVAIDIVPEMIKLAQVNGNDYSNVFFKVMDSDLLKFDNESFDIIISRHASFNIAEAERVLKKRW